MSLCHVNVYVCCFEEIKNILWFCLFVQGALCIIKLYLTMTYCMFTASILYCAALSTNEYFRDWLFYVYCFLKNLTTTASFGYSFYCRLVIVSWEQIYQS